MTATTPSPSTYVIAEAGVNHNGSPELALALVDAAAATGADAVKFQHFDPGKLAREDAGMADYQAANMGKRESQRDMLSALRLSRDVLTVARSRAVERGLDFLCTPFDDDSARDLVDLVPAWKVSSTDLTNYPFLALLAELGRPLILSSGMATLDETVAATDFLRGRAKSAGRFNAITMLHCVSAYPAPLESLNLRCLPLLAQSLPGVAVGYSDHSLGIGAPVAAVALGAVMVEKHLTLDKTMPGPDHRASADPGEFSAMVAAIRQAERSLGQAVKAPQECELEHRRSVRRSLHAVRDLSAGHILTQDDLIALRPADGIEPSRLAQVLGRALAGPIMAGRPLHDRDLS